MSNRSPAAEDIIALEREWERRAHARDTEWIAALHAPHARQFPPAAEPVVGAPAIRAAWERMLNEQQLHVAWEPEEAYVAHSRDMAYDHGRVTITTPDGRTIPGKYLVVWTREQGEWKVAVDMFSPNVPSR
ncbi:MAG TPA: DUF4440 domain-containing protein [Gemmatimonadaceae bacterium]|nr:DUF4440 domain-containing protein [Gemmatimonadaceae bacterium]